ncbi:cytoplasmic dynein 1 light intermediate chain 2 [Tachyglossus aculeatus]|uniref:cytoplasmic dynein 1 light intermediate chain 2 n=1 Tax=Tachyglossus aculeatus TaxID=9261 RepID=UPI0018F52D0B|nr:cytoplasmic dynein 1 light intermediate chain 2 [Tachyglossus aculeatus]
MEREELGYGRAEGPTGEAPQVGAPAEPEPAPAAAPLPVPILLGVCYLAPVGTMPPPPEKNLPGLDAIGAAAADPATVYVTGAWGEEEEEEEGPEEDLEEEGERLWTSILSDVSAGPRSKLPAGKTILVLGDTASGKTTLMARLQGATEDKAGSGLKYLYLNIHDEDVDDHTRCNVWILDGDLFYRGLLKFVMNADSLLDTLPIFVADMSRPWTIMKSLQKWASVLREYIDKLRIPAEDRRIMELNFKKDFQSYVEPGQRTQRFQFTKQSNESIFLPLGNHVLTHNFGIPVLVVCTKCDAMSVLEKAHNYTDEHFDFIQSHVRRFCLKYGAGLIYTSAKEGKNLDILFKYIVHKIYGFPFTTPALLMEKDVVFIPAGWDNDHKIAILHESFTDVYPEDDFEDFIIPPPGRKLAHFKEVVAEDDQEFLMRQQAILAKQQDSPTRESEPSARGAAGSSKTQSQADAANVPDTASAAAGANTKSGSSNEGVLANFFNSLLTRKSGCPMGPVATGMQSTAPKPGQRPVLRNVQEELGRMNRKSESAKATKYSRGKHA